MYMTRRILSMALTVILTIGCTVTGLLHLPTQSAYATDLNKLTANKDIYVDNIDGQQYFCYETTDRKIETSIGYRTIGLNVFVGKDGTGSNTKSVVKDNNYSPVTIALPNNGGNTGNETTYTEIQKENGTYVTTIRRVPMSDIIAAAQLQGNTAAADVFASGKFSMVVDGIMTTFTRGKNGDIKLDAKMDQTGMIYIDGQPKFYYNDVSLQQAKAWMGVTGINTHFNKIWKQGIDDGITTGNNASSAVDQGATSPNTPSTPTMTSSFEPVQSTGKLFPDYYAYHNSDTFDVGEGIPSGESMTAGFYADDWYGLYSYQHRKVDYTGLPVVFTLSGTYTVHNWYFDNYDEETGEWYNYRDHPYEQATEKVITIPVNRCGDYWAIISTEFYKLSSIGTENGSYGSHTFGYSSGASATAKVNGSTPSTTNEIPPDDEYHVSLDSTSVPQHSISVGNIGDRPLSELSDDYLINAYNLKDRTKSDYGITVRNDALSINGSVGSIVCLEEDVRQNDKSSYDTAAMAPEMHSEPQKIDNNIAEWAQGSDTVTIPQDKSNGKYDTTLNANYSRFLPADGVVSAKTKTGTDAIWSTYQDNEPVVVHTPVYDYIKQVLNDSGNASANSTTKTQLIETPATEYGTTDGVESQTLNHLLLDGTYTLKFDTHKWLSEQTRGNMSSPMEDRTGTGESGYHLPGIDGETGLLEKYTQIRKVRFPFDVMIVGNSGNKTYYPVHGDYTDWIKLDSDTFKFYIPTWAQESNSKFGNGTGKGCYNIQFRVEAYNTGGNTEATENLMNSKLANYVATFNVPCNVSGIIYGFQIVGCNDRDMYTGYNSETTASNDVAFALLKEEKKVGTKNRLGSDSVRYTLDGTINNAWDLTNTIPTRPGSSSSNPGTSHVYSGMGAFWKGTTFSYSVKTIANLGDSTQDSVYITPSFRYFDADGNETNAIKVYYTDSTGNFIEVGSDRDKNNRKTFSLGNAQFKGSWYQGTKFVSADKQAALGYTLPDNLSYTVANSDASSEEQFLTRKIDGYSMSDITLNYKARLFSGDDEELAANLDYERSNSQFWKVEEVDGVDTDTFRKSMQTWYGQFNIPEHLYVCYNGIDIDGDGTVSILGSSRGDIGYHESDDLNGDGKINLTDYGLTGNLSRSSSIWLKSGYLMLNFDIKTKNNGIDHLTYNGGENCMWDTEGRVRTITLQTQSGTAQTPSADNPTGNVKHGTFKITTKPGDICLVDLRYGLNDKYSAHIFMSE